MPLVLPPENQTFAENQPSTITENQSQTITENQPSTEHKPDSNEKPYGEDAIYISYDPVVIYGSLPESQEIGYIKEDKVIFKFLYSSKCSICMGAIYLVPRIKEEFGERIIVDYMGVHDNAAQKWRDAAIEYGHSTRIPFTLSIGMNSLFDDEIKLDLISYTAGFSGDITWNQWIWNICSQFKNKPESCSKVTV